MLNDKLLICSFLGETGDTFCSLTKMLDHIFLIKKKVLSPIPYFSTPKSTTKSIICYWFLNRASLVAQTVKTQRERPRSIPELERSPGGDMATHSSVLAWRIPRKREAWQATVHGVAEWDTTERLSTPQLLYKLPNFPKSIFLFVK